MVYNWPQDKVDAIVVTDGSRILGLGDLGANGAPGRSAAIGAVSLWWCKRAAAVGADSATRPDSLPLPRCDTTAGLPIPIGKLDLYVAAGGFNPRRVLPCVIDVGTNNAKLLGDDLYMGLAHPRITGDEYYEIVDEFVRAVTARWPNAVLQFEDFSMEHAKPLLERYRWSHTVWNDDIQVSRGHAPSTCGSYFIQDNMDECSLRDCQHRANSCNELTALLLPPFQGTACTALAGLYGAMRVLGQPLSALTDQTFVVVGAGSAGMGVTCTIAQGRFCNCRYGPGAKDTFPSTADFGYSGCMRVIR